MSLEQKIIEIEDNTMNQVFLMASERQRMAYVQELKSTLYIFLSHVLQNFSSSNEIVSYSLDQGYGIRGLEDPV
jgi:uncharacterized protein YebE (UPF0316 family)